ncbi:Dipeptide-binding ABC transporter, periplasmic substrate-binding component (TC 3.A.1.5.2) [hydrothermal vent metagenome]|uniref:Dipeptide-binding ABC transporter, periplasmic substrate-binding component (TC 3.A.1.5.2) n=1 Tax=hydrothermal vent metagenome TaxID=652676 RepID=A0A1W1EA82_9ZZZZ
MFLHILFATFVFMFAGMSIYADVWNNPYSKNQLKSNIYFSSFFSAPKHLDPVISYNANEWSILGQIYEPPLQYNYLKRPYTLEPLTLKRMPEVVYLDNKGKETSDENRIAYSRYRLHLRSDIFYHPHPAFVKDTYGRLVYGALTQKELASIEDVYDFSKQQTRRLKAEDYAYAIKRMAVRQYHSPILDSMIPYIVGLRAFSKKISAVARGKKALHRPLDLRAYHIKGVKVIDDDTLEIDIYGKYPQFLYWLAMNFFAPIPWEADLFYQQEGLHAKNISLDSAPVGTGAYYLAQNDPNRCMRLKRNTYFHTEYYPTAGKQSSQKLPFIDEAVYMLEKESIPMWNKFLQGYYDASGIASEAFDQAVQIGSSGEMGLSDAMRKKGIRMITSVQPSIFYMAFNMEDPVVGGYSPKQQKLRQAISIAQNEEEYISIFMNGRGVPAQGPIPPGIFGYEEGKKGTNPFMYEWYKGKRVRKGLDVAKRLLAEAGYPDGISQKTGKRLKLYYDTTATGPDDRALMEWRRKQFAKLGITLVIRATDYNRFQEKVRKGKVQLFSWGWNADYPDPENFLFLLYGKNAVVDTDGAGINSANYKNPVFDKLFEEIKSMENTPKRLAKIEQMLKILQKDAPWVWGFYPKSVALVHSWFGNVNANAMANNTLKYKRIDPQERVVKQEAWNRPVTAPLYWLVCILLLGISLLYVAYLRKEKTVISRSKERE